MTEDDGRYDEIRQYLNGRKQDASFEPLRLELVHVLDLLDVQGALEGLIRSTPTGVRAHGPKTIYVRRGEFPSVGVVIWYFRVGFYGYQHLTLLGVWATMQTSVQLIVGRKVLPYHPPIFNPESYHRIIRREYSTYYKDDNKPPANPLHVMPFDPDKRIALRQQLGDYLTVAFSLTD